MARMVPRTARLNSTSHHINLIAECSTALTSCSSRTTTTISTVVATTTKLSLPTMPPCRWQQPELSIGPRCQSLDVLGVYKCWSLKDKSPAHLVWNKVYKAIITLLEDQFEHLDARDSDLMVEMFMIGRKARTSSPTVLFSCESKSCRRKAIELVQKNSILACHPGISMAECSRLPRLLAFGEGLEMPIFPSPPGVYVNGPLRSCGIDVLISGNHDKSPRKATVGGLVCVDDDYYGLTCAHAFSEAGEPDTSGDRDLEFAFYGLDDPDDSSDDENDSVGMTSQGSISSSSGRSQTTYELGQNSPLPPSTDSISTDQDPPPTIPGEIRDTNEFTKPVLLGTLFAKTAPGLSFDWALVKIEHPDFLILHTTSSNLDLDITVNKISSRGRVLCPKHIAHPSADARVLVCTGSIDGTYEGTLSRVASFMKAPGSEKFQEMWIVRCPDGSFSNGDCGSWVVDFESGVLYGHIISGYPGTGTAYFIPAVQIFCDMKKCLGKPVQLSTAERKASSLSRLQESALIQPARLGIETGMTRTKDQNPPCNTLYIGNLPFDTSEDELKARASDRTSPSTTSATPKYGMNAPAFSQSGQAFRSSNGSQLSYQPLSDIGEVSMRIIVGIDIGLTCTGVAIATDCDAPNGRRINMRVIERWPGTDRTEKKVPTRVAYTAGELGIHSWGFGCPELRDLGGGMVIKDMFKFFLDTSYVGKFGPAPYKTPKRENVRLWYKDFLTALYAHIIEYLRDTARIDLSSKSTSIEFVFSIPTAWKDDYVLLWEFRDIVDDAGFGDTGNVIMELTEGEAAAVFTSKRLKHRFLRGEAFMVCDAGGGTTDMCVLHVKGAQDDIVELENLDDPKALPAGSVNIDDMFEARAKYLLGFTTGVPQDKIADLALQITRGGFQDIKRQFGTELTTPIKVIMLQVPGLAERIAFPLDELKAMFDSQVDIMIEAIDKQISLLQFSKPSVRVSYLFLAGGLGSSKYVQDRLVEHCKSIAIQVLFAPDPDDLPLAVCKGLVIDRVQNLCHDRPVIPIRSSKSSYGILYKDLYGEKHSGQPSTTNQLDGKRYAENQIDWLVVKGSHNQRGQLVPRFYSILADPNMVEQSWGFSVVHSTSDARTLPTFLDDRGDVEVVCHVTSSPQARLHECGIAQKRGLIVRRPMFSRVNCELSAEIGVGNFEFKSVIVGQMEAKSQTLKVQWSAENRGGCDLIRHM